MGERREGESQREKERKREKESLRERSAREREKWGGERDFVSSFFLYSPFLYFYKFIFKDFYFSNSQKDSKKIQKNVNSLDINK